MKTIIICTEPFPIGMAATKRIICYAKALCKGGIPTEVAIFSRTESRKGRRNYAVEGEFDGIPFKYMGRSNVKPSHKIPRLASKALDRLRLKSYLKEELCSGDTVLCYVNSDTDFMIEIAGIVHAKGAHFVRELCEIPFYGLHDDKLPDIYRRLFPLYDGFLCISESLAEVASSHKNPKASVLKIPILVDYEKISGPDESVNVKVPYLFHCGTLTERKDGITSMMQAYKMASERLDFPTEFILAGEPDSVEQKQRIESFICENSLQDKIRLVGYQQGDALKKYLLGATSAVINKTDNPQNHYGFSTKLADYLASGTLVIMSDVGEAMNYLQNDVNALIVPPSDLQALSEAIVKAFTDRQATRRMAQAGIVLCKEKFDWRSQSENLANFIRSL